MANRLAADRGGAVLLLEAADRTITTGSISPWVISTASTTRAPTGASRQTRGGLNGRALSYPRGKVLGGCSSINGMIYMRGQARDYDQWRQMGCEGWGWDDVLPLFRKSEDFYKGADEMHGSGGEWRVEKARVRWAVLEAFQQAAKEAGIPETPRLQPCGTNEGSAISTSTSAPVSGGTPPRRSFAPRSSAAT